MPRSSSATHHAVTKGFFLVVACVMVFLFWKVLSPFLLILATAGVAAIVLTPLANRLEGRLSRPLSAVVVTLLTLVLFVGPLCLITIVIGKEILDLLSYLKENQLLREIDITKLPFVDRAPAFAQEQFARVNIAAIGAAAGSWALSHVGSLFAEGARFAMSLFLFFISLYYLLVDRASFKDALLRLSPFQDSLDKSIVKRMTQTVRHIVFGALIIAVIQGIFAGIGMAIFGVPNPALWGSVTMVAAEVPIFGVGMVLGPAIAYLFLTGATAQALGLLIWGVVIVGLVDNILSPLLIKGKTNMHALFILLSILGGLQLFGPIGFVIGPTILAGVMIVIDLYQNGVLEGKLKA